MREGRPVALALSEDHKPNLAGERARITAAGGHVTPTGRVNGNLNLSRSLGDLKYKKDTTLLPQQQVISPVPDVTVTELDNTDCFLVSNIAPFAVVVKIPKEAL